MYNKEVKMQYLDWLCDNAKTEDRKSLKYNKANLFNRLEKIEIMFGVDIAEADYESGLLMVNLICKGGKSYQSGLLSDLKKYIEWCILNGQTKNTENFLDNVSSRDIDTSVLYKVSMLKDEKHLIKYLDIALRSDKDKTTDVIYKSMILLIYSGIKPDDILEIKEQQVDLINKVVKINGINYNLSDYICGEIENFMNLDGWNLKVRYGNRFLKKVSDDYLIRGSNGNRGNLLNMCRQTISKSNQTYRDVTGENILLSMTNIFKSSIFHKVYQGELETGEIDLSEFTKNFSKTNDSKKSYAEAEYINWKKAFNL